MKDKVSVYFPLEGRDLKKLLKTISKNMDILDGVRVISFKNKLYNYILLINCEPKIKCWSLKKKDYLSGLYFSIRECSFVCYSREFIKIQWRRTIYRVAVDMHNPFVSIVYTTSDRSQVLNKWRKKV